MEGALLDSAGRYRIRSANEADAARAGRIAREAWAPIHVVSEQIRGKEMHDVLCANWADEKENAVINHWKRTPEWFRVVEDTETGEVVAFVTFRMDKDKHLGLILNNAVAPGGQGKGVGTMMYAHVLDLFRAEGLRFATVGTGLDEGHAPARRAYEKAGFNIQQPTVTYYQYLDRERSE